MCNETLEYFVAHIVDTPNKIRIRIDPQDTVNVTIVDDDGEISFGTVVSRFLVPIAHCTLQTLM